MLFTSRIYIQINIVSVLVQCLPKNTYISHYEPVVLTQLTESRNTQHLDIQSRGEYFCLNFHPKWSVISHDTTITLIRSNGSKQVNTKEFLPKYEYEGTVNGNPQSSLSGSLENGIFDGVFAIGNITYYLEPYLRYFTKTNGSYNAIFYNSLNVHSCSKKHDNGSHVEGLGMCEMAAKGTWMRRKSPLPRRRFVKEYRGRQRRFTHPALVCEMRVIADFRVFEHVAQFNPDNIHHVIKRITGLLQYADESIRHLALINETAADNIGLFIKSFIFYLDPIDNFRDITTYSSLNFFQEFYQYNFTSFCAGLLFTSRVFHLIADRGDAAGDLFGPTQLPLHWHSLNQGICATFKPVMGLPTTELHSYGGYFTNALPVNFYYKGGVANDTQMRVQTLHQVGHLFGTYENYHIYSLPCDTGPSEEWWISHYPINPGKSENNLEFSPCDKATMKKFVELKAMCLTYCFQPGCPQPLTLPGPNIISRRPHTTMTLPPRLCWTDTVYGGAQSQMKMGNFTINTLLYSFMIFIGQFNHYYYH